MKLRFPKEFILFCSVLSLDFRCNEIGLNQRKKIRHLMEGKIDCIIHGSTRKVHKVVNSDLNKFYVQELPWTVSNKLPNDDIATATPFTLASITSYEKAYRIESATALKG